MILAEFLGATEIRIGLLICWVTGIYPLGRAWQALRQSSLGPTMIWTFLAWLTWGGLNLLNILFSREDLPGCRYSALCMTCCAGVAVLGARRPGVEAWNFVVVGLLVVMLLPLAEQWLVGEQALGWLRWSFLALTLAIMCLNYLPTCFWAATLVFAGGCAWEFLLLLDRPLVEDFGTYWGIVLLACVPWVGFWGWQSRKKPVLEFDVLWLNFRNRIGVIWAQRIRDQFNRAAANAQWNVQLDWQGLHPSSGQSLPAPSTLAEITDTLRAMLKRFH